MFLLNKEQLEIMKNNKGFIAALDQSGGSTPKALLGYGVTQSMYNNEDEMFNMVHDMRTRIITSPGFSSDHILGAILFEQTMNREIAGMLTADYLWKEKGILSFLKVDKGLEDESEGVQLMKPIKDLDSILDKAVERNIFGTKMRAVIKKANPEGIKKIVDQQFEIGKQIIEKGLVPILEPEVDINAPEKEKIEKILHEEILKHLNKLDKDQVVMLKVTIPTKVGLYTDLIDHPQVMRVVALSGGYTREVAVEKLKENPGLIASFSRALLEGLNIDQSDEDFNAMLRTSVEDVYEASIA